MPKFLYTVLVLLLIPASLLVYILLKLSPSNYFYIFLFLTVLFFFLSGILSIIGYFLSVKVFKVAGDPRYVFRKILRISLYLSLGVFIFLLLRGFKLVSILNILLSLAFYLVLGYQLFYSKKDTG